MLAWSIRQFLVTQKIAKSEFELWVKFLSIAMILSKSLLEQGWPMMHGFFIIMGRFHPFEHGFMGAGYYNKARLHDHNVPLHPLATCNLFKDDVHQSIRADIREDTGMTRQL